MTPNWTWTFNSQKYSIHTKYLPLRPIFWSVSLYNYPFPRYMSKVAENRKCTEWSQGEVDHTRVKKTLYTLNTPWDLNFDPFRSTTSRFRDTGSSKTEMLRMTQNWIWTLDGQKCHVYIKHLPMGPKFWSVSLYGQQFRRYRIFYHSPLTTMLNGQKKKNKRIC